MTNKENFTIDKITSVNYRITLMRMWCRDTDDNIEKMRESSQTFIITPGPKRKAMNVTLAILNHVQMARDRLLVLEANANAHYRETGRIDKEYVESELAECYGIVNKVRKHIAAYIEAVGRDADIEAALLAELQRKPIASLVRRLYLAVCRLFSF